MTTLGLNGQILSHFTPLLNLPGIVEDRAIYPWSSTDRGEAPAVDVLSAESRAHRATVPMLGARLDSFVPLSLGLASDAWHGILGKASNSLYSSAVEAMEPKEFCLLVTTIGDLGEHLRRKDVRWGFTDRSSADPEFKVSSGRENLVTAMAGAGPLDRRRWRAEGAEVLVSPSVPFKSITRIIVHGSDEREFVEKRVFGHLREDAHRPLVHVAPHWFEPLDGPTAG